MSEQSEWISLGEAAALLGVHPTTLRNWADQGELPSQRTPGGHRRFQRRVVEQWLSRRNAPADQPASEAHIMMQSALGSARLQVSGGQLEGLPWYDHLSEEARREHRALGRSLLDLLTRYLAETETKPTLIREVQAMGAEYARRSIGQGLALSETVQAFLFFRDLVVESMIELAGILSLHTPVEWGQRLRDVNHITDELLLALIEEYQSSSAR